MLIRLRSWFICEQATAAIEAALVLPVMLIMLFGIVDLGRGLILSKKITSASQIAADLMARQAAVSDVELEDAIIAAELALMPYDTDTFGVDIVSVQFVGAGADPTIGWRETRNMEPYADVLADSAGLGAENEGVLVVSVRYFYTPRYASFFTDGMEMIETAFVRGRISPYVDRE